MSILVYSYFRCVTSLHNIQTISWLRYPIGDRGIAIKFASSVGRGSGGRFGIDRVYGPTQIYWATSRIRISPSGFWSVCFSNQVNVESSNKTKKYSFHFFDNKPSTILNLCYPIFIHQQAKQKNTLTYCDSNEDDLF